MPSAPKWILDAFERLLSSNPPVMVVVNTVLLTKGVKKICFEGDFSKLDYQAGYYMDFRVGDTEVRRYTAAYMDPQKKAMEFIAHLHGKAPGSQYMENLKIGDKVNVNALRGHRYYDCNTKQYIFFGDETSLALAKSFLPFLANNGHQFQYYFELDDENKDAPRLLELQNYTIVPKRNCLGNEEWTNNLPFLDNMGWENASFILTGNTKSVKNLRKVLKARTKGKIYSQGYWLEGKKGL